MATYGNYVCGMRYAHTSVLVHITTKNLLYYICTFLFFFRFITFLLLLQTINNEYESKKYIFTLRVVPHEKLILVQNFFWTKIDKKRSERQS